MSRIANAPVQLPSGVEVTVSDEINVKGGKGSLSLAQTELVEVLKEANVLRVQSASVDRKAQSLAGTYRALVQNMVTGVSEGFTRELELQGVGYRAQAQGKKLTLSLGFSHPVEYQVPEGIEIETPSQTQVIVKVIDKQLVGQLSAEIRAYRPPEPYKGKVVRYVN